MTREQIEHRASSVVAETGDKMGIRTVPPVPVDQIATELFGLQIDANLRDKGVLGELIVSDHRIRIRPRKNIADATFNNRQRFTIAHELGHFLLHVKFLASRFTVCSSKDASRIEWEANTFAASILVPKRLLYQSICLTISQLYHDVEFDWLRVPLREVPDTELHVFNSLIFTYALKDRSNIRERAKLIAGVVPSMAKLFQVSKEAMTIRFKEVGLLAGILDEY